MTYTQVFNQATVNATKVIFAKDTNLNSQMFFEVSHMQTILQMHLQFSFIKDVVQAGLVHFTLVLKVELW